MLGAMPQQQLIGLILFGVGIVDSLVGHLLVAPRIPDESKRNLVKIAFSISGVGICGLGLALYKGLIVL
jgi:hypothetical protein